LGSASYALLPPPPRERDPVLAKRQRVAEPSPSAAMLLRRRSALRAVLSRVPGRFPAGSGD